MIREEAISRLRDSKDWEKANLHAAEFWTKSVESFKDIQDAIKFLESCYHYLQIRDDKNIYENIAQLILKEREDQSATGQTIYHSFYIIGLSDKIREFSENIPETNEWANLIKTNIGLCYLDLGEYEQALEYFNSVNLVANKNADDFDQYLTECVYFCLSFTYSFLNNEEEARKNLNKLTAIGIDRVAIFRNWGRFNKYLVLLALR